jgi:hypothetical protein
MQGGSLVVNTEFGMTTRGATDLADLINAADKGLITPETFVRERSAAASSPKTSIPRTKPTPPRRSRPRA